MLLEITEGWTGTLGPFTLRLNGNPLSLSGLTVELRLRNSAGAVVTPGGVVTVNPDQIGFIGQVSYAPVVGDFTFLANTYGPVCTYLMHWKVTDGAGKIVFFPNGAPDEIGVHRA